MAIYRTVIGAAAAAAAVFAVSGAALAHGPQGYGSGGYQGHHMMPHHGQDCGPGMMGYGMGPGMMGYGMGPGMMGYGMGQGMDPGAMGYGMGHGMMGRGSAPGMMQPLARDLSAAEVQHMLQHRLAWGGNPNVKVGKVEETDEDTIVAEIVTQDGSLVQRLQVDRHSGWMRPAQ